MARIEVIEFTESSLRKIGNVKEALNIFLKQGYGYKQIVKAYFSAFEISDGRGYTFSVEPFINTDLQGLYDRLPSKFKQALPIEVAQKNSNIFKEIEAISVKTKKPLKEVAKEYFKPKKDDEVKTDDGLVRG